MKKHIIPLFFILITFTACKPDLEDWNSLPDSWFTPCEKGESCVEDVQTISIGCFDYGNNLEMIIDNQLQYISLQHPTNQFSEIYCIDHEYPEIDFENYILLVKLVSAFGCESPKFEYKIQFDGFQLQYNIYITIHQLGGCTVNQSKYINFLLPKKQINYPVNYIIKTKWYKMPKR